MMGRRQSISFAGNPRFCLEEEQKVTVKSRSWILSVQGICIRPCLYSKNVCDEAPFQYGFCCFTRHGVLCSPFDRCHGLSCNARNQHGQVHIVTLFEVRSSSVHFVCALFISYGANIRLERLYWRIHAIYLFNQCEYMSRVNWCACHVQFKNPPTESDYLMNSSKQSE